jgi:hypothetical protein
LGLIAFYSASHISPPHGHTGAEPLICCCKQADMSEIITAVNAEVASKRSHHIYVMTDLGEILVRLIGRHHTSDTESRNQG